jgi:hypothetical protein
MWCFCPCRISEIRGYLCSEVQYTQGFSFCGSLKRTWQSPQKFRHCSAAQYIQWRVSSKYSFTGSLITYSFISQNIYRTLKKRNFGLLSSEKFDLYKFRCSVTSCSGVPRGGWGVVNRPPPPPEIPKFWQSRTGLQIERKMFSVPIPTS